MYYLILRYTVVYIRLIPNSLKYDDIILKYISLTNWVEAYLIKFEIYVKDNIVHQEKKRV